MSNDDKKLQLLTELAKLPPHELAKLQITIERRRAREMAKAASRPGVRLTSGWGAWPTTLSTPRLRR